MTGNRWRHGPCEPTASLAHTSVLAASVAAPALTEPPGIAVGVLALLAGLLADLAVTVRGRVHHRSRMVSTP